MEKLFWIIQIGPKYNDMYPYKREAEGDFTHIRGRRRKRRRRTQR